MRLATRLFLVIICLFLVARIVMSNDMIRFHTGSPCTAADTGEIDRSCLYISMGSFAQMINNELEWSPVAVAEYCVTDSLGRKTGYDITSHRKIKEIPGSHYWENGPFGVGDVSSDLMVMNPISGDYTLEIVGVKEGGYCLTFWPRDSAMRQQKTNGGMRIISPGTVHQYSISFDRDNVNNSQIHKIVSIQEIQEGLRIALNLKWIDNQGIFNSLNQKLDNAKSAARRGKIEATLNLLEDFINEVNAQRGMHIRKRTADILIDDAQSYIEQLKAKK
jgi:hypothetical protein